MPREVIAAVHNGITTTLPKIPKISPSRISPRPRSR